MPRIKKILVPVDFSDYSKSTVEYAVLLAGRFHASIDLVHVIEPFAYDVTDTAQVVDHYGALIRIADRLMINARERITRRGIKVRSLVLRGSPAPEIVNEARRRRADLIIMGTHGRTGLEHLMLGSVAERVVRLAPCPVLTVRSGRRSTRRTHRKPLPLI